MLRIGIPRTLAYFIYYPFWKVFFTELGHEVVLSSPTTRDIMDKGVKEAVNDACIPIKIYHGHVADLIGKADYIFCPRMVSVRKHGDFGTETFCPKFLGLPDMIRLGIKNLPPLLDVRIDLKKGKNELKNVCLQVGHDLGNENSDIVKAMQSGLKVQKKYQKCLTRGIFPEEAMDMVLNHKEEQVYTSNPEFTIAVVGYPYTIYDPYINVGLIRILQKENVKVVTQDMLNDHQLNRMAKTLPKSLFWYFSNRAVYGALNFLERNNIDGIIHITAFACGPDSMVDRLLEIETHRRSKLPYMSIMIDEQTGEAGIQTRIEAFIDMLRYRKGGEEYYEN
ncbi:MAG TPA: acyl-CoA dehydratase activase-related protein [Syntrophomonadaceae bacterium]|nr:acyl-CoA dehydratase activase-related protein [Syntrophomonadaceae bacterium]